MNDPNDTPPTPPGPPAVINPRMVLTLDQAAHLLDLPPSCLPREARLGRLRTSRRAGRLWTTGEWLLAWLKAGEITRRKCRTVAAE